MSKAEVNNTIDSIADFLGGAIGAVVLVLVGQPLDTIKVKMQTFPKAYKGIIHCGLTTVNYDGVFKGLYAGTVPAIISNVTECSTLFLFYGVFQKLIAYAMDKDVQNLFTLENAAAGGFASIFVSIAITPTEILKCRRQACYEVVEKLKKKGIFIKRVGSGKQFIKIIKQDGISGIFRGIGATLSREIPGCYIFFLSYEAAKEFLREEKEDKDKLGLFKTSASGAFAGLVYWTMIYPVDLAKSRIQTDKSEQTGVLKVLKIMLRKHGLLSLYSGLTPTIIRAVPSTAALFISYEYSRKFIKNILLGE